MQQNAGSLSLVSVTLWLWALPNIFSVKEHYFLLDFFFLSNFCCADSTQSRRKRVNVVLCRLLSKPDIAFQGLWHRFYPGEWPRCPAERKIIFSLSLEINALLKSGFTTDTKCSSLRPRDSPIVSKDNFDQDDRKVTSNLMGILRCHSCVTPWKKQMCSQHE